MAQVLDYAAPSPRVSIRNCLAILTLALGAVIYAALCWPAMRQRGYPPIDHFWNGVTYLWVVPVLCFTLICLPGRVFYPSLAAYALATAYIKGCTIVEMVPHRFNPLQGLVFIFIYGPIHLILTAAIAESSDFILAWTGLAPESDSSENKDERMGARIAAIFFILLVATAFPFLFRRIAIARDFSAGEAKADMDWADHSAYILSVLWTRFRSSGDYDLYDYFDPESGLPLRPVMGHEYEAGYMARVERLLSTQGVPPWSHKQQFVSDADILNIFKAKDLTPVTTYPCDLSPCAVLIRGGSVNRWGGTFISGSSELCVDTQFGGNFGQDYYGDAATGRLAKYPGVIFVRGGDEWIAAISEDGWLLKTASKSK
jgi:hypothetical protein